MIIYPNPALDAVYVELSDHTLIKTKAVLTDLTGKVMQSVEVSSKYIRLAFKGIPSGSYDLTLADGRKCRIKKE